MLKPPGIDRVNKILLFTILISITLYFGKELFVLLTFSCFFAMLMTPISNKLEDFRFSRVLSSVVSVFIIVVVISAIILLLSAQITSIGKELPLIESKLQDLFSDVQQWISDNLGISSEKLKDHATGALNGAGTLLTGIVKGTFTFIGRFILVLVFTFLFLMNRDKYKNFVLMLYRDERRNEARIMLSKISKISHHYLAGRLVAVFIIGIFYIIGFTIVGLKDGIILSALAALVTVIPYIGALIGGLIPFFMAFINGSINQALGVVVVVLIVNVIDHYFIEPYVVGGSVSISPLFTILILILGGVVWGLAGIILFLPLLGILKIVLENFEGLHPYAFLMGDQRESSTPQKIWAKIKGLFGGRKR
jgi:predicted PurR-regulated permease PerM